MIYIIYSFIELYLREFYIEYGEKRKRKEKREKRKEKREKRKEKREKRKEKREKRKEKREMRNEKRKENTFKVPLNELTPISSNLSNACPFSNSPRLMKNTYSSTTSINHLIGQHQSVGDGFVRSSFSTRS
jgi:sRNA-binding protein